MSHIWCTGFRRVAVILTLVLGAWVVAPAQAGYYRADFNLDGVVDTNDLALWTANQGRTSAVPRPDTILTPALRVNPDRRTLLAAESNTLHASGGSGVVHWAFVKNNSGATLTPVGPTSAVYQAGNLSTNVDIIEAWTADNPLGRSFMNVIDASEVAALGKAIIVAGGKSLSDPVWLATDYLADKAFGVLRHRGYSKANINYLSFGPNKDVDNNGALDDIAASTAFTNVAAAFTNWANNSDKLFVYLADHGSDAAGEGYFRLNAAENLTAVQLDAWLDLLQDTYNTEVIVVMDFCYSGSFLDELAYDGVAQRIVIASTNPEQLTYFIAGGAVSFSDLFFSSLLQGLNVYEAFQQARDGMSAYQDSTLDDDGDGAYTGADGTQAAGRLVGASFIAGKDIPIIGKVLGNQLLTEGTAATLWADDIESYYPLDRVWTLVIPPSHSPNTNTGIPVVNIPEVDLVYDNGLGRHQATYPGFSEQGTYRVNYYARDIWDSVSPPRQSLVIQAGVEERLILVEGGPTSDVRWATINNMARTVYETFRARQLSDERIFYLSAVTNQDVNADGTNDVDRPVSWANLQFAVTNWASNVQVLTVYLIGETSNSLFRLNGSETLGASALDALLDQFQASNQVVNVVMEFAGSGSYIPALVPPGGRERISIASTAAGKPSAWLQDGRLSFSSHFMSYVFHGHRIAQAHQGAKNTMISATGKSRQTAQLDDNGNGIPNEIEVDGAQAILRFFGPAFVTGEDSPVIGSVLPSHLILNTNEVVLWAKDILDVDGISNVWAVITPPDFEGVGDLPVTNLAFHAENNRYEARYSDLDQPGTYTFTYYAQDNKGHISPPSQTLLTGEDAYEPDDTAGQAGYIDLGDVQVGHNFHSADDEDWIRLYVSSGQPYKITATQQGTNVNVMLNLYYEEIGGSLSNIYEDVNDTGRGLGNIEFVDIDTATFPEDFPEGFYLLQVSSADTNVWGLESEYDVSIDILTGGGQLIVVAVDKLNPSQSPPGAVATINNASNKAFSGATSVTYPNLAAGVHTVRVTVAAGYLPEDDPNAPNQSANMNSALYGNPKRKSILNDTWQSAVFQFVPYARADGLVRDKDTGEWIAGAKIEFTATSGTISNYVYDGYPNFATYETQWFTRVDGSFPTNVLLPTVNWNLKLSKAGYSNLNQAAILVNPAAGAVSNLGTRLLRPVDANGNQLADWWELLYFGPGTNVVAGDDTDGDGHSNAEEYLTGTHPTNSASAFKFTNAVPAGSITLTWPVAPGRVYRVLTADDLTADLWSLTSGPTTAAVGQTQMQYVDPAAATNRHFRIEVSTP